MSGPQSDNSSGKSIDGVIVVPFKSFGDDRGYFFESYRRTWLPAGAREMVQGNCSFSKAGVLRGLHYHRKQADLWAVPSGSCARCSTTSASTSPTLGASQVLGDGRSGTRSASTSPRGSRTGSTRSRTRS